MLSPQSMHCQNFDAVHSFFSFGRGLAGGGGGWVDDGVVESGGVAKTIVDHFI